MILAAAGLFLAVSLPKVIDYSQRMQKGAAKPAAAAAKPAESQAVVEPEATMSLQVAQAAVVRAQEHLSQGRFERAEQTLAPIPAAVSEASGASDLSDRIAEASQAHELLTADLENQVAREQWTDAHATIRKLASIAPLAPPVKRAQRTVLRKLAAQATYDEAQQLLATGKPKLALAEANEGFERYGEVRMQRLATRIETQMAAAAAKKAEAVKAQALAEPAPRPNVVGTEAAPKPAKAEIAPANDAAPAEAGTPPQNIDIQSLLLE